MTFHKPLGPFAICYEPKRYPAPVELTEEEKKKQAAVQRNREMALARYHKLKADPRAFKGQTHNFTLNPTPSKTIHYATGINASI